MNQLSLFQFYDKYSRWNNDAGRRETWEESVTRAADFLRELSQNKLPESDYERIYNAMYDAEAFCSMRLFAMAGEAARRQNLAIFNCSYSPINSIDSFVEILNISMAGCGAGFSVESRYTNLLPEVKEQTGHVFSYVIPDTTEGWCEALRLGLTHWFHGLDIEFDYSQIRPAGSILKVKGGRASGPQPLQELLDFARKQILSAQGRQLTPLEVHDIVTMIGGAAVSGGSRRSAQISLFDLEDDEMMHSKDYGWWKEKPQRSNANNSVVIEGELTYEEIHERMMVMHESGGGEPGIFSRYAANLHKPERREEAEFGTNPCQPGFATVLTPAGIRTFDEIDVGSVIWSGKHWTMVIDKWSTGVKPVYVYNSSFGQFIGTEEHKVVEHGQKTEVRLAETIDAYAGRLVKIENNWHEQAIMDGLVLGDGSTHKASGDLVFLLVGEHDTDYFDSEIANLLIKDRSAAFASSDKGFAFEIETTIAASEIPYTYERRVPERYLRANQGVIKSFLRGLFSANGSVVADGRRVTLKQTSHQLIRDVQQMLSAVGIRSYITVNRPSVIEWHNGTYESRQSYDLNITQDRYIFLSEIGFLQKYKNQAISGGTTPNLCSGVIQSREYLGDHPVYDIMVFDREHTYWTGGVLVSNCGEINLRPQELCNLSQAILRPGDTYESVKEKVEVATIIGCIQATATHYPGMRPEWRENSEEERLLGVDLTAQMDVPHLITPENLEGWRDHAVVTAEKYSRMLKIKMPAAVTCNKPSGNSSVLFDCSPGIHTRWAPYYIRRARVNANSPMRHVLETSGMTLYPENGQEYETANTLVAEFPARAPEGAITNGDRSAVEQCEWWLMNKKHWTEHNPSVTISYREEELPELIDWIYEHQEWITGMSFLPYDDHYYPLAPYEAITKEEYERRVAEMPKIDFSLLEVYEKEDHTTVAQELACFAGQCLI